MTRSRASPEVEADRTRFEDNPFELEIGRVDAKGKGIGSRHAGVVLIPGQ
jgi:hypothetical protein